MGFADLPGLMDARRREIVLVLQQRRRFLLLRRCAASLLCTAVSHSSTAAGVNPATLKGQPQAQDDRGLKQKLSRLLSGPGLDHALSRETLAQLSPEDFDRLLREMGTHGVVDPRAALGLFSFASDRCGFQFTVGSYCFLVCALIRADLVAPARLLLIRLIGGSEDLPVTSADPRRRFQEIVQFFLDLHPEKKDRATMFGPVDLLVHVCCTQFKSDGLRRAFDAFMMLIDRGVCPSLKTCNYLLGSLAKMVGGHENVCSVFEAMKKYVSPDVYSYTPLIDALCKGGLVEEATRVFSEMESSGVYPNVVTYNALIDGLCKNKMLSDAFRYKDKMVNSGINPTLITYSILINGLAKLEKFQEANGLLHEMFERGISPNEYVYNSLIDGYCRIGMCQEALKLRDGMKSKGMNPTYVTYNSLLKGLCRTGEMEKAESLLEEMLVHGIPINVGSLNSIISWLCTVKLRYDSAVRLFKEMVLRNLRPNDAVLTKMVEGLCRSGRSREAIDV